MWTAKQTDCLLKYNLIRGKSGMHVYLSELVGLCCSNKKHHHNIRYLVQKKMLFLSHPKSFISRENVCPEGMGSASIAALTAWHYPYNSAPESPQQRSVLGSLMWMVSTSAPKHCLSLLLTFCWLNWVTRSRQSSRKSGNIIPFPPVSPNIVCLNRVKPETLVSTPNTFHTMENQMNQIFLLDVKLHIPQPTLTLS